MNPYYVPKDNSKFTNALAVIKLGLDAYNDYQRNTLSQEHEDLMREDLQLRRESSAQEQLWKQQERDETREYRKQDLAIKQQGEQREQAKLPEHQKNWGRTDFALTKNIFSKMGVKETDPVMQALQEAANTQGVTKGQVYESLIQQYPSYSGQLAQQVAEDYAAKVMKDANYANTREGQSQRKFVETLESDPTGEKSVGIFFRRTKESLDQERAKAAKDTAGEAFSFDQVIADKVRRGELSPEDAARMLHPPPHEKGVAVKGPGGQGVLVPESQAFGKEPFLAPKDTVQWSAPEYDENGNRIQKSNRGEIKVIDKVSKEGKLTDIEKQELIGIRADLRVVNRELAEVRRNAGYGIEAAKNRLPMIEAEYNDLKAREKELLSKDAGGTKTTPAVKPTVNAAALIEEANQAIARGADPAKVKQRLKTQYGITVK